MNLKPFELANKFVFIVNIEYVDRIVLKYGSVEHTFSLSRTSKGDETLTIYRVNDIEAAEDSFKNLYQSLIGLIIDTDHRHSVKEDSEVILTYYLNRGKVREYRISFTPFDSDFFAVFKNGLSEFLISRDQVRNMIADVGMFISKPAAPGSPPALAAGKQRNFDHFRLDQVDNCHSSSLFSIPFS